MKVKTSVTLSPAVLSAMNIHADAFKSRSEFVEIAVRRYLKHLEREKTERLDIEIIDQRADALNAEAEDVLSYQVLN